MKRKNIFTALLAGLLAFSSCTWPWEKPTDSASETPSDSLTETQTATPSASESESVAPKKMAFQEGSFDYDGMPHSIYVENAPEGSQFVYDSGNGMTEPGTYSVKCKVTLPDGTKKTLTGYYSINKLPSIISCEEIQESYIVDSALPTYTLNNTEQTIALQPVRLPGVYTLDVFAAGSAHYKESNHVKVQFTVHPGNSLGVVFESQEVISDGKEHVLEASNVPEGYQVSYHNNKGTDQGKYNAQCIVSKDGDVKLTINAILKIDNPINTEFNEYLDEFFSDYLSEDYLSINIFTEHPENFNLVRDEEWEEPSWYTYTHEDPKEDIYKEILESYDYLLAFKDAPLSYEQKISYDLIDNYFGYLLEFYDPDKDYNFLAECEYISSDGGYPAIFVQYMTEYKLRSENDIKDIISYCDSVPDAFASYLLYCKDKEEAGYPLSDYTINEMQGYLTDVTKQIDDFISGDAEEDFYFAPTLCANIDKCDFIDSEAKNIYKNSITSFVHNEFNQALKDLNTGLEDYKGKCKTEGYLSTYGDMGKDTFKYELAKYLGYSVDEFDLDAYTKKLEGYITKYTRAINGAIGAIQSSQSTYNVYMSIIVQGTSITGINEPEDMIDFLKEFARTIVSPLSNEPDIEIFRMDDAAAKISNAVAYYKKSALDSTGPEIITLNPLSLGDVNETLLTMAHEGYPGHLYAYNYTKDINLSNIARVMTNTSHGEGWATYVEQKLIEYLKSHNNLNAESQEGLKAVLDYMSGNTALSYLIYTYIDLMIHTQGWTIPQIALYMNNNGFNGDYAEEIYRTLIEVPGNYACYGYGQAFMLELHDNAKKTLGVLYDEIEFNKVILEAGWCPLEILQAHVDEYVNDILYLNKLG